MNSDRLALAGVVGGILVMLWVAFQIGSGIYALVQFQRRAQYVVNWYDQVVAPQILRQQALEQAKAEQQAKAEAAKPTPGEAPAK